MDQFLVQVQALVLSQLMKGYATLLRLRLLVVCLDATLLMFGTIKDGIMEMMHERLGTFRIELRLVISRQGLSLLRSLRLVENKFLQEKGSYC